MYFKESVVSHGKMFIKPSHVTWLTSPHRLDHYWIEQMFPEYGGVLRHFDSFRYSNFFHKIGQWDGVVHEDNILRDLTLSMLSFIGVELIEQEGD
jgi:hypothetical protein